MAREHRGAGCPFPRLRPGWKTNFSKRPFLPAPFPVPTRYSAPHSEPGPLAQPPISGACAPGPARDWSPGRPSSLFFPAPALPPPGATTTQSPGAEKRGGHPPGRSHMLPRAGPRVPSRFGRPPRSPARPGRPGAPPAARPCRRTGGRDRLLLRKFQVRKQGHTFPGEGQAARGRAGKSELRGIELYPQHPQAVAVQGQNPGRSHQGAARENWARNSPVSRVPLDAPACLFLRGSSSGLQLRRKVIRTRLTFCPLSFVFGLLIFPNI